MVIPGCHSGKIGRGSVGGVCEQREDNAACVNLRGCYDNSLFKRYPQMDIIMEDS